MSDSQNEAAQNGKTSGGVDIMDTLKNNVLWVALSMIVLGAVSTFLAVSTITDMVRSEVEHEVLTKLDEELNDRITGTYQLQALRMLRDDANEVFERLDGRQVALETALQNERQKAAELELQLAGMRELTSLTKVEDSIEKIVGSSAFTEAVLQEIDLIPTGAILAFDQTMGCPAGWQQYAGTEGRVIVGAGSSEADHTFVAGQLGGSRQVTLTIDEIPEHQHLTQVKILNRNAKWGVKSNETNLMFDKTLQGGDAAYTAPEGGGKPHDNMPPYIVLNYCIKQ